MTAAFIIIDAQNMWFHPDGKMYLPMAEKQVPLILAAKNIFKKHSAPTIYTKVVWDRFEDVPQPLVKSRPLFLNNWIALQRGSFGGEIYKDLAPESGDIVVEKKYFDAFQTGDLQNKIPRNVDTLVFAGTTLNNCVYSSLLSASQRGFKTILLEDGTSHFPGDNRDHWFSQMRDNLGTDIISISDLASHL
ncbi:MAG: isochorismatase family cysteine hydrolase [Bdellovibrionota bacterium]